MYEDDLLIRQIRRFANALAKALGLRRGGDEDGAMEALDELSRSELGLGLRTLQALPLGSLEAILPTTGPEGPASWLKAARLLAESLPGDLSAHQRAAGLILGALHRGLPADLPELHATVAVLLAFDGLDDHLRAQLRALRPEAVDP